MKTTLSHALLTAILTCGTTLLLLAASPAAAGDWQEKLLFHPPESQLRVEQHGRIMIYDGLKDTQVARAMDTQFDRIESMMFVRTVLTDGDGNAKRNTETGQMLIEDDGC